MVIWLFMGGSRGKTRFDERARRWIISKEETRDCL